MKKIIFLIIIFLLLFGVMSSAQGVEFSKPGLTPDNPFYFLDALGEKIGLFFTFGTKKKAEKAMKYAEEKLAEAKAMAEKNKTKALEKANQKYEKFLELSNQKIEEAKEKGKDVEELAALITEKTLKHQEVLIEILEKVPEEAKPAIQRAMTVSRKGSLEAIKAVTGTKKEELKQESKKVKAKVKEKIKIEGIIISDDGKSILETKTKWIILAISETQNYLKESGYEYNPETFQTDKKAQYLSECFVDAALSPNKNQIVFSTGCLPGDLPQAWVGLYDIENEEIKFLAGSGGRGFSWSADELQITYIYPLGLSGLEEFRTITAKGRLITKEALPEKKEKAFLGIRYMMVSKSIQESNNLPIDYGALITGLPGKPAVEPDSPAEKAGIKENDIIIEFNGQEVRSWDYLPIDKYQPGQIIILKILRQGEEKILKVILGEWEEKEAPEEKPEIKKESETEVQPQTPKPEVKVKSEAGEKPKTEEVPKEETKEEVGCQKLNGEEKDKCYNNEALTSLNEDICEKAGSLKDACYNSIAREKNDENLCEKTATFRDDCYTTVAKNKKEEDLCQNIENLDKRVSCYTDLAYDKEDDAICEKSEGFKEACYSRLAAKKGDLSLCEKVADESIKLICYWPFAPSAPSGISLLYFTLDSLTFTWESPRDPSLLINIYHSHFPNQIGTLYEQVDSFSGKVTIPHKKDKMNLASGTKHYFTLRVLDQNNIESRNTDQYIGTIPSPELENFCTDTDWWGTSHEDEIKTITTKGTCTDKSGSYTDVCFDERTLKDYACRSPQYEPGGCSGGFYSCPSWGYSGCQDGICK